MTAEQWRRVQDLFDSLADLSASDREAALARADDLADSEVLSEVKMLLSHVDHELFLDAGIPGIQDLRHFDSPALVPGYILSTRFEIVRLIGRGGMGEVYEAVDLQLKERIAIKILRTDLAANEQMIERFSREVQLARKITHINVCRIFDFGRGRASDGTDISFLSMELIAGDALAEWVNRTARPLETTLDVLRQIMNGLEAAHSAGVLHCDLKPANVLVSRVNGALRAVITDFGLARTLVPPAEPKRTSRAFGTPAYISPEQIDGRPVSARTDIYALGLLMYEVITGSLPFSGEPGIAFLKRITRLPSGPKTMVPDLPASWDRLILRCLEPDPERRFNSIAEVQRGTENRPFERIHLRLGRRAWIAAALGGFLSVGGLTLSRLRTAAEKEAVPAGAKILLTPMASPIEDAALTGVTSLMAVQLGQSAHIVPVDPNSVPELLKLAEVDPSKPLDPESARHVSLRLGIPLVLFGGVFRVGDEFMLNVVLEQLGDSSKAPRRSWSYTGRARDRAAMMDAIRDAARWVRTTAGETRQSVELFDKRPEDATTGSWEALQQFAAAERAKSNDNRKLAVAYLKLAVSIDPEFALAHARLGDILFNLHEFREGLIHWRRASQLSTAGKLSKHEQLRIQGLYFSELENFKEAESCFEEYSRRFPHDDLGPFYLAYVLRVQMRIDESLAQLEEANRRYPGAYYTSAEKANCLLIADRRFDLRRQIELLRAAGHADAADRFQGTLQAVEADAAASEQTFSRMLISSSPQTRDWGATRLCYLWSETGRYGDAIGLAAKAIEDAHSAGDAQRAGRFLVTVAWVAWRAGDRVAFERAQAEASTYPLTPSDFVRLGTLLARSRRLAGSLRLIGRMETDYGGEFSIGLRKMRMEILLAEGETEAGLRSALEIDREDAAVHCREYLANALWVAGQKQEAQARYRAIAAQPNMPWYEVDSISPGTLAEARRRAG